MTDGQMVSVAAFILPILMMSLAAAFNVFAIRPGLKPRGYATTAPEGDFRAQRPLPEPALAGVVD